MALGAAIGTNCGPSQAARAAVFSELAAAKIAVDKSRRRTDARQRVGNGLAKIAENGVFVIRDAVRMGGNFPLKHKNVAFGEKQTQVVVGAAVTEAKFEHRTGNITDQMMERD